VIEHASRALGAAVVAALALLDLETVILGGYLSDLTPWLAPGIEHAMASRLKFDPLVGLRVEAGTLGEDATMRGVIQLAQRSVLADPTLVRVR
jgi:predicted NBD/HSP70 family sugar kinase